MSETLEQLFGSKEKMRLIRFFLLNPEGDFDVKEIVKRNMLNVNATRRELANLLKIKFISKHLRKGRAYFAFNPNFTFYPELKNLITKANIYPQSSSLARLKNIGNIRFAAISGAFINYPKSKADMILVGDGVSRGKLRNLMNSLEAEIGKEIDFVLMTSEEFKYRLNMLDKFILEFLEGPHEELVNKIPHLHQLIANLK